jgi:hypothetical protein
MNMQRCITALLMLLCLLVPSSSALAQQGTYVAAPPALADGSTRGLLLTQAGRLAVDTAGSTVYTQHTTLGGYTDGRVTTTAVASSLTAGGFHFLLALDVVSGASAGYVMVFNTASAPADGAVTPQYCYAMAANSTLTLGQVLLPTIGNVTIVFSTTGCFTKTASATAFISMVVGV